ncbi:MAG TPA: hypothetical protein VNG71_08600 [Pyrinomonadaceae bacterium]|nr:hypothetical protein [Pyrinomonadaceae bacterium]
MPSINNRQLTLTTVNDNVTINVAYNAVFSAFERRLAGLGLAFRERIAVLGVDPDEGSTTGSVLHNFTGTNLAVTDGAASQTIPRNVSMTVPRRSLQEDTAGDRDEICCRIRIEANGLPPAVTPDAFTDQENLLG